MQISHMKSWLSRNHSTRFNLKLRKFARIAFHRDDEVKPDPKVLAL